MGIEKQLITPPQPGGAPIYIEDLAQMQTNTNELVLPWLKHNAAQNGFYFGTATPGGVTVDTKAGAFISPPIYSNVVDDGVQYTNCDVAPFSVLLDDKVCFYPGGSIRVKTFSGTYGSVLAVTAGTELKEPRIFRNGETHEVVVTHEVVLTEVTEGAFGWASPSSIIGKFAVCLDPRYHHENGVGMSSKYYYQKHPNGLWNLQALTDPINKALGSVQTSDSNVSQWYNGAVESSAEISGSLIARIEGKRVARLAGDITVLNVSSNTPIKIATLPTTTGPEFPMKFGSIKTQSDKDNHFSEYEIRTDRTIWATFDVSTSSNGRVYFDGVTIPIF